jgi:hypothetical protein
MHFHFPLQEENWKENCYPHRISTFYQTDLTNFLVSSFALFRPNRTVDFSGPLSACVLGSTGSTLSAGCGLGNTELRYMEF